MTTLAARRPGRARAAARRPLTRWAWRLFRREWRRQILLLGLLSLAVAAAIGSVTVAYNSGPSEGAEFGSANHLLRFDGADPRRLQAGLAAAEHHFGTFEVIGHRSLAVPGAVDKIELRAQDPHGVFGGARLTLRQGAYPHGPGQVAITDGVATILGLELGNTLELDGRRLTIVGVVENPLDLSDEFALVSRSSAPAPDHVTVLVDTDDASFDAFIAQAGDRFALAGGDTRGSRRMNEALAMFSVATVFLLLAALVAAAGFAVIAQRRLRQLGMLAAIGATEKHLRLVLLWNGAVVGAIGALIGTVAGLGLWLVVAPVLETTVGHRIDRLGVPWLLLAMAVLVAVAGATAAAWWPGRAVSRVPVMLALSARPPRPKPAHHSAIVAALLIAAGVGSLVLSERSREPLIIAGILATIFGTLLLGPLAIRVFARPARNTPIAVRLALRDLARFQARSGAALAAITLALGIAAAVVVVAAAEERKVDTAPPNLSDRQIRVYTGVSAPEILAVQTAADLERKRVRVDQLAATLDDAAVIPLDNAVRQGVQPGVTNDGTRVIDTQVLTRKIDDPDNPRWSGRGTICFGKPHCYVIESRLYVATPVLLRYLGIDPASVEPNADFLADAAVRTDELVIPDMTRGEGKQPSPTAVANVQRIDSRKLFGSPTVAAGLAPDSFVTPNGLRRLGWKQTPSGWLVEASEPLTSEQIADAREFAAENGLTIETRRERSSTTPIAIATAAGAFLALAILAMTVGLIRSETAGDLRTLTATGATSRIRRMLTGATAGTLALLGAVLGVAGAYLALVATYLDDLVYLSRIPVLPLALIVVGVPLAATAAGWLLAGREPPAVARSAIE
jgi:putative ABC transport system permease protein